MGTTIRSSQHDEALQKTAARLIYILGLDDVIETCRSNDWPRVLRFVLAYKAFLHQQPHLARPTRNGIHPWLDTIRHRMLPNDSKPAIAA